MKKEILFKILKYIFILLLSLVLIGLLYITFIILNLFGIIEDYRYVKINDNNREVIKELIKEQKNKMFNNTKDVDFNKCINSMNKIEMEYLFPDGENYQIYCKNKKYNFSLDDVNYDLPNYIYNNGKVGYKLRLDRINI